MNEYIEIREENHLANVMAVVGLIVMICLLAWLAVQLVRFIPTTFSRLAEVYDANQQDLADRTDDENVVIVNNDDESDAEEVETPATDAEDDETSEPSTPSTPTGSDIKPTPTPVSTPKPTPTPVQYRTVVTYKTPVSDPKGFTDLLTTFVAVGEMTSSERFVAAKYLSEDERSAMQFNVRNIGSKTSGEWHFVAELPDGSTINSLPQKPLLPNESATLTIAFDGVDGKKDRVVGVRVVGGNDINANNNNFRVTVDVK